MTTTTTAQVLETCQHMYCGTPYIPRPYVAIAQIQHSGYRIPLCGVHYAQMRDELTRAHVAFTARLLPQALA